jgi:SpoVK/Ycf46/Vps4 family AAA+-type ATPase
MDFSDILLIILLINFLLTNKKRLLNYTLPNKSSDKKKDNLDTSMQLQIYNDIKDKTQETTYKLINYLFVLAKNSGIITNNSDTLNKASSIIYELNRESDKNTDVYKALLKYLAKNNNSKFLKYHSETYYVINTEPFYITDNIQCTILEHKFSTQTGDIEKYRFEVFSTDVSVSLEDIKRFIDSITDEYEQEKHYTLGRNQYYFNEIISQIPKTVDGGYRYEVAPKTLTFSMSKFASNRSMSNIFGAHLHELKERVDTFINNKEWYVEKGIPYTLGIMISGPPGTGKTSIIKAIAADTGRHIINVNLRDCTTKTQLYKLFYDEEITVNKTGEQSKEEQVNVPLDRRIYVIEDIDCMNDIVLDREILNFNPNNISNDITIEDNIEPVETVVANVEDVTANVEDITNGVEEIKLDINANTEPEFKDINGDTMENIINSININELKIKSVEEISNIKRVAIDNGLNERLMDDINTGEYNITADYCDGFATSGFTQIQEEECNNEPLDISTKLAELMANRDIEYDKCAKNVADGVIADDIPSLGEVDNMFGRVVSNDEAEFKLESEFVEKTFSADFEKEMNDRLEEQLNQNIEINNIIEENSRKEYNELTASHYLPLNENDFPSCPGSFIHLENVNVVQSNNCNDKDNDKLERNDKLESNIKEQNDNSVDIGFKRFQYIMNRREQANSGNNQEEHPEKLTLSDILNIFDGVLETPGRIIIATSNHPYVLDPALVRPGRIDLNVETGYCDADMIVNMFKHFYCNADTINTNTNNTNSNSKCNNVLNDEIIQKIVKKQLTPAELNNIILTNKDDANKAINKIID